MLINVYLGQSDVLGLRLGHNRFTTLLCVCTSLHCHLKSEKARDSLLVYAPTCLKQTRAAQKQ